MKRDSDEKRLKFLANIFVKLDKNNSFEEQILFDESYEASSLHKIKYYFDECSNVKFVNWSSGLVPIFIKKSIGCNIFLDKSTCSTDIEKYFFENELQFEFCEDQFSMTYDAVFSNNYIKEVALNFFTEYSRDNNGKENIYKLCDGRLFKLDDNDFEADFYISDKRNLEFSSNIILKKGLSGFSLLRNADIYPFDLCYASVLDKVDEFILGVDTTLPDNDPESLNNRDIAIERFLDTTEYADKVKIVKFDFKERYNRDNYVRARWIADVNTELIEHCNNETIVYLQADEMFHDDSDIDIRNFCQQDKFIAMNYKFNHFVYDLKHIQHFDYVSYNYAIRVFKRNYFTGFYDGFNFMKIGRKWSNMLYYNIKRANTDIYHLGYVVDFRKKMNTHRAEGGVFYEEGGEGDDYFKGIKLEGYNGTYPNYLFCEGLPSSLKVKKYL